MPFSAAVTMVIGTFASGATRPPTDPPRTQCAHWASMIGFFAGNGLMILAGAYCAIVINKPTSSR